MAKKGKSQLKKKSQKTSHVKLANKKRNKAAKQGKLKKQAVKKQQSEKKAKLVGDENKAEEVPLEEDDINYYGTPGRDVGFVSSVPKAETNGETSRQAKKRRKVEEEEDDTFEQLPRKQFKAEKPTKALLPIKADYGIIQRVIELQIQREEAGIDMSSDDSDASDQEIEEEDLPLPELSTVELYANRQKKLKERKDRLAKLGSAIMENPEENVGKLRELRGLMDETDADIFITVRKYAMISLAEIFKDILPDYRIRVLTDKEKEQKQKKETAVLREYEQSLVRNYQLYLQFLERMIEGNKKEKKKKYNDKKQPTKDYIPQEAETSLRDLAIKCMCTLLVSHPEFNYRSNLVAALVPFMNHESPQLSDQVCQYFQEVLKADKMGDVSLEVVRIASKYIKSKGNCVKTKMLNTFLSLRIKEVDFEHTKTEDKAAKHERLKKMSRRERKRNKKMVEVEKELEEAAVNENKHKRIKLHTQILEAIFVIYFRILKRGTHSVLLASVLEGLAKFAHLINIEFFGDLFNVITNLLESGNLTFRECLHCVKTAFTILTGQGSALNIDPNKFYINFYSQLIKLHMGKTSDNCVLVLECIEMMMNKRRKQVNQSRALAYIKRLASVALQQEPNASIGLLASVRSCLHAFPRSDLLFDNEAQSSGIYLPELDDPEHCHAENTQVWELHLFRRHYHPIVKIYSEHLCRGAPLTGEGQLQPGFKRTPCELYAEYTVGDKLFYPPVLKGVKKVKKRNLTSSIKEKVVDAVDDLGAEIEVDCVDFYKDFSRSIPMKSKVRTMNGKK